MLMNIAIYLVIAAFFWLAIFVIERVALARDYNSPEEVFLIVMIWPLSIPLLLMITACILAGVASQALIKKINKWR